MAGFRQQSGSVRCAFRIVRTYVAWAESCYRHPGENDEGLSTVRTEDKLQQVGWVRDSDKLDVNGEAKEDLLRCLAGRGLGCAHSRTCHEF